MTHLPEVQCIDLRPIFQRLAEQSHAKQLLKNQQRAAEEAALASSGGLTPPNGAALQLPEQSAAERVGGSALCLVLCTDGVWDNWLYEDVTRFVVDPSCLGAVAAAPDGARRVTMSFMQRNSTYSKRNFGGQADNATGIVMYISSSPDFPAL